MADNTIFDDVFRTIVEKMPELTIPLINEVFGTKYPVDAELIQKRNEHQTESGRISTDSCITIGNRQYHMECQSTDDATMIIRMIEYDFAIGLEYVKKEDGIYHIRFPYSCVIYLRGGSEDRFIKMIIDMPDGQMVEYKVPVVRTKWYSVKEIFAKKLIILLPFYMMRYEKMEKQWNNDLKLQENMFREYADIEHYLEQEFLLKGEEKAYRDITELTRKIVDYIFSKSQNIRKGLGEIMGGQVLELESDRLIKKGEAQGKVLGEKIGADDMAALMKNLLDENRMEELKRVTEDEKYREEMLKKFKE